MPEYGGSLFVPKTLPDFQEHFPNSVLGDRRARGSAQIRGAVREGVGTYWSVARMTQSTSWELSG